MRLWNIGIGYKVLTPANSIPSPWGRVREGTRRVQSIEYRVLTPARPIPSPWGRAREGTGRVVLG